MYIISSTTLTMEEREAERERVVSFMRMRDAMMRGCVELFTMEDRITSFANTEPLVSTVKVKRSVNEIK